MGDGSEPEKGFFGKILGAGKRLLTGESVFMTHFTNNGHGKKRVSFAAPFPGKIIPINMNEVGGQILCQKDSFLAAALGTKVSMAFNQKIGTGFFGGEGFILQKLEGDGMAFIHAGGTITRKELKNSKIMVDTGCIVGFTAGIDYNIERSGGLKSMVFGGEGLFLATLSGTGSVWLQSLPFSRLADRILAKYGIDVEFTRHFVDRLNDPRNSPAIKVSELQKFFKKIQRNKGRNIRNNPDVEAVLKDMSTNLNLPVVIKTKGDDSFEVTNKTIMRKKDFRTTSKVINYA